MISAAIARCQLTVPSRQLLAYNEKATAGCRGFVIGCRARWIVECLSGGHLSHQPLLLSLSKSSAVRSFHRIRWLSHRFPWGRFGAPKLAGILLPIWAIMSSFCTLTVLEYLPIRVIRGKSVCHLLRRPFLLSLSDSPRRATIPLASGTTSSRLSGRNKYRSLITTTIPPIHRSSSIKLMVSPSDSVAPPKSKHPVGELGSRFTRRLVTV